MKYSRSSDLNPLWGCLLFLVSEKAFPVGNTSWLALILSWLGNTRVGPVGVQPEPTASSSSVWRKLGCLLKHAVENMHLEENTVTRLKAVRKCFISDYFHPIEASFFFSVYEKEVLILTKHMFKHYSKSCFIFIECCWNNNLEIFYKKFFL